jgi:catechol 2,3-dioxygenase-like lactoylglutathione lyase family enzyme
VPRDHDDAHDWLNVQSAAVFDHVGIRVTDRDGWERFYATVLATLGIEPDYSGPGLVEWDDFALSPATADRPVTRRLHIGFVAPSREHVHAFHEAGVAGGYRDDGAPGPRPQYTPDYYGAFLLDPDGNSAEAVHYSGDLRDDGNIDHLWVRVAAVDASTRFYESIAGPLGLEVRRHAPDHTVVRKGTGSMSLVAGEPTENVHVAFPAPEDVVREFHRAGVEAGYRDNGAPGERPEYHPGYYGAFLLDPDGNNIEAVDHQVGS